MTTANLTCSVTVDMSFTGAGGQVESAPRMTLAAKYQSYEEGIVAIPAGATASTEYDLAFGGIVAKATMLRIDNVSAAGPVGIKINGAAAAAHTVDVGGSIIIGGPALAGVTGDIPLTSASVILEAAQVAAGSIQYWVFGDPV